MNKHKNKNTSPKPLAGHLAPFEHDHMPREVAMALLGAKQITNRVRKNCMGALEKQYVSTFQPKALEDKLLAKFSRVGIEKLDSWRHRLHARRMGVQKRWARLPQNHPLKQAMEDTARHLDAATDCVNIAIKNRLSLAGKGS